MLRLGPLLLRRSAGSAAPPRALAAGRRLLSAGGKSPTLDCPFISDTVPLAEGILGTVEELHGEIGQSVSENEVIAVVETDKVTLDIKASRSGIISAILVEVGDTVKELQPLYELEA